MVSSLSARARIEWIDYARAIGIVLVVVGHVLGGLRHERFGDAILPYQPINDFIYSFHMPLFFALSGIVFALLPPSSVEKFLRSTLVGILIPYFSWSIIVIVLQQVAGDYAYERTDLSNIFHLLWFPTLHFWFLYVLFFVRAVYYTGWMLQQARGVAIIILVSIVLYVSYFMVVHIPSGRGLAFLIPKFLMGGAYFGAGFALAKWGPKIELRLTWRFVASTAAAWLIVTFILRQDPKVFMLTPLAAALGVAYTLGLSWLLTSPQSTAGRLFAVLGQASLAIYVTHIIFAAGTRIALLLIGVTNIPIHLMAGTAMGVILPTIMFLVGNRFEMLPYLGFGQNQRFTYSGGWTRQRGQARCASGNDLA